MTNGSLAVTVLDQFARPVPGAVVTASSSSPQAVASVGMDSDGNLLLNGAPFVPISGQKTDLFWWGAAGYTDAQAAAKLSAMQAAGVNTINDGNWGLSNGIYQDTRLWTDHGMYWQGSATLDDQGHNAQGNWLDSATITTIVNRFKGNPNLLRWYIAAELNPQFASTSPTDLAGYRSAVAAIRAADPSRSVVGDLTVFDSGFNSFLTADANAAPLVEEVIGNYQSTGICIQHIMDAIFAMRDAWNAGQRFVAGISLTPVPELDQPLTSAYTGPTLAEIVRGFFWPVALNVKAFEVLWGANQRNYAGGNNGDGALTPNALQVWSDTMTALSMVSQFAPVISAPGRFGPPLTTSNTFNIAGSVNNVRGIYGVYAAAKQVGSTTYVVAVNVQESDPSLGVPRGYDDQPLSNVTIDVGVPINTITRMFEGGSPSFSGSVLTDNFPAMGVHVYVVT